MITAFADHDTRYKIPTCYKHTPDIKSNQSFCWSHINISAISHRKLPDMIQYAVKATAPTSKSLIVILKAIKAISISITRNSALLVALKPQGSHWETICCNVSGKLEDCSCVCWPRLVDAHIALLLLSASAGRRALEQ